MSNTRTFKDKFKNAQEVTSLNTGVHISLSDAQGNLSRISKENLLRQTLRAQMDADAPIEGRWLRILNVNSLSMGLVFISHVWNTLSPDPICFMYIGNHMQRTDSFQVFPFKTSTHFTKLRVVCPSSGDYYLEIFVKNLSKPNTLTMAVSGNLAVPDSFVAGEIPAGATVKEFNLSQSVFGGGGKSLPFNKLRNIAERRVA